MGEPCRQQARRSLPGEAAHGGISSCVFGELLPCADSSGVELPVVVGRRADGDYLQLSGDIWVEAKDSSLLGAVAGQVLGNRTLGTRTVRAVVSGGEVCQGSACRSVACSTCCGPRGCGPRGRCGPACPAVCGMP